MDDIHKDSFKAEDCRAELAQVTSKLNNCNELIIPPIILKLSSNISLEIPKTYFS